MTWEDRQKQIANNVSNLALMVVDYKKDFEDDTEIAYFFGILDGLNAVRNDHLEEAKFQNIRDNVYEIKDNKIVRKEK